MGKTQLSILGDEAVKKIKTEFDIKGLNDTGEAQDSISFIATNDTLIIEGLLRTLFLQNGRRPDPSYNENSWKKIIYFIRPWVERKLNVPEDESFGVAHRS